MSNPNLMILLIDAGNTRAKFGWINPDDGSRETQAQALDYQCIDQLGTRLEGLGVRPTRIFATNVAGPQVGAEIETVCQQQFGLPVQWMDSRHGRHLLHNRYRNAGQLGADRWMGMLGLLHRVSRRPGRAWGGPLLLATFGTATTLDTILLRGEDGPQRAHFLGGLILPGPVLMARSLADHTAHLPFAEGEPTDYPIDTHNAISSGIAAAQAGALLRQWRNGLQASPGLGVQVYVSGGGWPLVQAEIEQALARAHADLGLRPQGVTHLANPVLDGLACLAQGLPDSCPDRLIY